MSHHDGSEYLLAVFGGQMPRGNQVVALMRFSQEITSWNLPIMISQALLVGEIVRTYPAEIRMFLRLRQRKKPNMAEIFFVLIKYLTLIAVILDIMVTETFAAKSDFDCRSWAWTSSTFFFLCSSLVFCVVAWRARIIFRTSKLATYSISAGLIGQFALAMWTNYRVDKQDALSPAGTCAPSAQVHASPTSIPSKIRFWQSSTFYFLLYNTVFEMAVMISCCLKLKRTSSGPGGLTQIAKVLFFNNVHYMAGVETCNVIELIMLIGWDSSLPPLHITSIAIQIIVGLQMLIGEQEAVYSPSCSRVTYSTGNYSSSSGSYSKPHHTTSSSNVSFASPGRALSYVRRPGTANTMSDCNDFRGRKGTFSSISSVPAYVKSSPEEVPPQLPPKSAINYKQEVEVSIDMMPLPTQTNPPAPLAHPPYQ